MFEGGELVVRRVTADEPPVGEVAGLLAHPEVVPDGQVDDRRREVDGVGVTGQHRPYLSRQHTVG
jgi:hypothetical protein